jgi:hypothetical protein
MPEVWHQHGIYTTTDLSAWAEGNPRNVADQIAAAAAARPMTHNCTLNIHGGVDGRVSSAAISCKSSTGTPLEVTIGDMLKDPSVNTSFEGIIDNPGGCPRTASDPDLAPRCLFKMCGTSDSIVIQGASITGLRGLTVDDSNETRSLELFGICLDGSVHLHLSGAEFERNANASLLAVIATEADAVVLTVTDSVFQENQDYQEMILYGTNQTMVMLSKCMFTANNLSSEDPHEDDLDMLHNGVFIKGDPVVLIEGCSFTENSEGRSVIIADGFASVTMTNCTISDNENYGCIVSLLEGGNEFTGGKVHAHRVNFTDNSLGDKMRFGAMDFVPTTYGVISDCKFIGNEGGPVVMSQNATLAVLDSRFGNHSGAAPATVFVHHAEVTIVQSSYLGLTSGGLPGRLGVVCMLKMQM